VQIAKELGPFIAMTNCSSIGKEMLPLKLIINFNSFKFLKPLCDDDDSFFAVIEKMKRVENCKVNKKDC